MKCPLCGAMEDKVIESRQNISGTTIRRRRECLSCNYRYTSYERIEEVPLMVVKRDGRRQPFSVKKMERGLQRACEKRPVPQITLEDLLNKLEDEANIRGKGNHEISSSELGEMVLQALYEIDKVAYVRFASVYRQFENVAQFVNEIENLDKIKE